MNTTHHSHNSDYSARQLRFLALGVLPVLIASGPATQIVCAAEAPGTVAVAAIYRRAPETKLVAKPTSAPQKPLTPAQMTAIARQMPNAEFFKPPIAPQQNASRLPLRVKAQLTALALNTRSVPPRSTPRATIVAPAVAGITPVVALAPAQNAPVAEVIPALVAPATAPPIVKIAAAPAAPPPIARDANGVPLVNNVFIETDLKQALSDVSAQTGVPIVADATVQGSISLELKDVPLEVALEMMLQTGGYAMVKRNGYYLVGMADPANPNFTQFSQTEVVELNHLSPRAVLELLSIPYGRYLSAENFAPTITESARDGNALNQMGGARRSVVGLGGSSALQQLGNSSPSVNLPPESDKVSITASPAMIERIKADIARLDKPRTQVMLEAVVLEISEEALKEIGLDFTTRFLGASLLGGGSNIAYSAIGGDETARLTALVRNGTARLRANPRVSTAEGQTAEIEVGRENYFQIDSGNNNFSYATLEVIKSGILLRITPKVLENTGEVMARIEPEVRDVTGRSSNGLPEITFRRAATNMRVRDGQSIVIGGLINEYTNVTNSKIPILGDLPLIGKIFRGTNSRKIKTEVVIIITPRILVDDQIPDMVQSPVLQTDLSAHREGQTPIPFAFPPKEKKQKE